MIYTYLQIVEAAKEERAAELLKVLAHPIRIKIISLLSQQSELNLGQLERQVKSQRSLVSHHLTKMSHRGVLIRRRQQREVYYALADVVLVDWLLVVLRVGQEHRNVL